MSKPPWTEVEKLIRQVKEGKEDLFKRIDPQIQKIVDGTCADMKISIYYEEVLEAVYERVVKGFDGFQGRSAAELKSWIRKIAENAARDFLSRTIKKALPTAPEEEYDIAREAARSGDQEKLHDHLNLIRFLGALDPVEGYILVLYSVLEYTFEEIAKILKLPNYTVRRRYVDIIKRVKKLEGK